MTDKKDSRKGKSADTEKSSKKMDKKKAYSAPDRIITIHPPASTTGREGKSAAVVKIADTKQSDEQQLYIFESSDFDLEDVKLAKNCLVLVKIEMANVASDPHSYDVYFFANGVEELNLRTHSLSFAKAPHDPRDRMKFRVDEETGIVTRPVTVSSDLDFRRQVNELVAWTQAHARGVNLGRSKVYTKVIPMILFSLGNLMIIANLTISLEAKIIAFVGALLASDLITDYLGKYAFSNRCYASSRACGLRVKSCCRRCKCCRPKKVAGISRSGHPTLYIYNVGNKPGKIAANALVLCRRNNPLDKLEFYAFFKQAGKEIKELQAIVSLGTFKYSPMEPKYFPGTGNGKITDRETIIPYDSLLFDEVWDQAVYVNRGRAVILLKLVLFVLTALFGAMGLIYPGTILYSISALCGALGVVTAFAGKLLHESGLFDRLRNCWCYCRKCCFLTLADM
jgi:hypothetical protein